MEAVCDEERCRLAAAVNANGGDEAQATTAATEAAGNGDATESLRTELAWTLALVAELRRSRGQLPSALAALDEAVALAPSSAHLLFVRSGLLAAMGDLEASEGALAAACELEKGDRFLVNQRVLTLLQLNRTDEADRVAARWTRRDVPVRIDLATFEARWFAVAAAAAHWRRGETAQALKLWSQVLDVYAAGRDDSSQYFQMALVKGSLRAAMRVSWKGAWWCGCRIGRLASWRAGELAVLTDSPRPLQLLEAVDAFPRERDYVAAAVGYIDCCVHFHYQ